MMRANYPCFRAEVESTLGSLYYEAELTSPNLRNLLAHVKALRTDGDTRVSMTLPKARRGTTQAGLTALLRELDHDGVPVHVAMEGEPVEARGRHSGTTGAAFECR
jgi:hypothetical protein